jgi:hypothetical protein
MAISEFWFDLKIIFVVICVLGCLLAFNQARMYGQRNLGPRDAADLRVIFRFKLTFSF